MERLENMRKVEEKSIQSVKEDPEKFDKFENWSNEISLSIAWDFQGQVKPTIMVHGGYKLLMVVVSGL